MHVVLVNPPNHRFDLDDLAPPLGLLRLSQSMLNDSVSVEVLDFNLDSCSGEMPDGEDFYEYATARISCRKPKIVGFTSMGINSHVSLRLAANIKQKDPHVITVFGGAHLGAIAEDLFRNFPFVDFVISGQGERTFSDLVRVLHSGKNPTARLLFDHGSPTILTHPWDAYATINLSDYFILNERKVLNFETARGCKYKCSFCYSPAHWTQRLEFPMETIISDFEIARKVGAKHLFVVDDNFLNDRHRTADICTRLAEIRDLPTWNCYASLPDIHAEIPTLLSRARCNSAYIGIDAVTSLQKKALGKFFAKSQAACLEKIRSLVAKKVTPTCSFIIDAFWPQEELEETFRWATKLRLEGAELSFHILTKYPQTKLSREKSEGVEFIDNDFRIRLMFDCPEVVINNPLAMQFPQLFPFHVNPVMDSEFYKNRLMLINLAQNLISLYPYELNDLLEGGHKGITCFFEEISKAVSRELFVDAVRFKIRSRELCEEILCKKIGFIAVNT